MAKHTRQLMPRDPIPILAGSVGQAVTGLQVASYVPSPRARAVVPRSPSVPRLRLDGRWCGARKGTIKGAHRGFPGGPGAETP